MNETQVILNKTENEDFRLVLMKEPGSNVIGRGEHYCVNFVVNRSYGKMRPQTNILCYPADEKGLDSAKKIYMEFLVLVEKQQRNQAS